MDAAPRAAAVACRDGRSDAAAAGVRQRPLGPRAAVAGQRLMFMHWNKASCCMVSRLGCQICVRVCEDPVAAEPLLKHCPSKSRMQDAPMQAVKLLSRHSTELCSCSLQCLQCIRRALDWTVLSLMSVHCPDNDRVTRL